MQLCATMLFSCAVLKVSDIQVQGTYLSEDNLTRLVVDGSNIIMSKSPETGGVATTFCEDTIAYGVISRRNEKTIWVNSSRNVQNNVLPVSVLERSNTEDSIFVKIIAPLMDYMYSGPGGDSIYDIVNFNCRIWSAGSQYTLYEDVDFVNGYLVVPIGGYVVEEIVIEVVPNKIDYGWSRSFSPRVYSTMPYVPSSSNSNVFEFFIPALTVCYLGQLPLYQSGIEIISSKTLYWRGAKYRLMN